jgi:hypothetical protein
VSSINRRDFIKSTAVVAVGAALPMELLIANSGPATITGGNIPPLLLSRGESVNLATFFTHSTGASMSFSLAADSAPLPGYLTLSLQGLLTAATDAPVNATVAGLKVTAIDDGRPGNAVTAPPRGQMREPPLITAAGLVWSVPSQTFTQGTASNISVIGYVPHYQVGVTQISRIGGADGLGVMWDDRFKRIVYDGSGARGTLTGWQFRAQGPGPAADSNVISITVQSIVSKDLGATNQSTGVFYPGDGGPKAAVDAAAGGDTILVNPGTYNVNLVPDGTIRMYRPLTFKSSVPGQLPIFTANGAAISLFYVGVANTLFEEIGFTGNVQGEYGANIAALYGVEKFAVTLTVRKCKFWECQHGILNSVGDTAGTVVVEDSEFHDNGNGTGFYHNMYISAASFTLRGCWVHDTFARNTGRDPNFLSWGHLVKSRAVVTVIEGCRLTMEQGEANRCIDLPNGGDVTIRGNLLEMIPSLNSNGGGQAVSWGGEENINPGGLTVHKFRFEQNTLVNHPGTWAGPNTRQFLFIRTDTANGFTDTPSVYSVNDNVFAGITGALVQQIVGAEGPIYEPSSAANTLISTANMNAEMPGHATFNFTPATPVQGSQNWATRAYAHPTSTIARSDAKRGGVPG